MDTFQAVIYEQPHKIPLLSGAIQVANSGDSSIGQVTLESFHARLQESVEQGNWDKVKLISRFITLLYPIVSDQGSGIFKLLHVLLDRAIDLQNVDSTKRNALGEALYTTVLFNITYLISIISPSEPTSDTVKDTIKELVVKSNQFTVVFDSKNLNILAPWIGDKKPYEIKSFVLLLRAAVNNLVETWSLPNFLDIPALVSNHPNKEDSTPTQHVFPAVNIPENIAELAPYTGKDYATPRLFFSIYLADVFETVPAVGSIDSLVFRDISTDIINHLDFNRKEVARQIITLDLFFDKHTFTEPGITMDRLQELHASNPTDSTWKVEEVALEAVLEGLFKLPNSNFYGSYFHTILIEACIMTPQAIAPVFGRAIRFLYSHMSEMDVELQYRFLDWFSHHLSNFSFSWKWQEWKDDIKLPDLHPRKVFMKQLIAKEVRLSYVQRIKDTLPEELQVLLPVSAEEPVFKYLEGDSEYQNEVHKLINLIREAKEKDSYDGLLQEISEKARSLEEDSEEGVDPIKRVIDIVVGTICYLGNRSISHAEVSISRSKELLLEVCPNDYSAAISSVMDYWVDQPFVGLLVVANLVREGVVPPEAYVAATFEVSKLQYLVTSNLGWESLERIAHIAFKTEETKEKFLQEVVLRFEQRVSEQEAAQTDDDMEVDGDDKRENMRWALWWTKGTIRSLLRKYHKDISDQVKASVTNEYIKSILEEVATL